MKSYDLLDYLEGPPITKGEVREQETRLDLERLEKKFEEINSRGWYEI